MRSGASELAPGTDRRSSAGGVTSTAEVRHGAPAARAAPRLLVLAYACDPAAGSEPGAGWGVVRALAESAARCDVVVGGSHAESVAAWTRDHPDANIHFVVVPEPPLPLPLGGERISWFRRYLRWMRPAREVATALAARASFDAVVHVTYSTYWLPSPGVGIGPPLVFGPVGGAVTTPPALWPALGWRGVVAELVDYAAVRAAAMWPRTRRTWRAARAILVQNEATLARLPRAARARATVCNHALFTDVPPSLDVPPPVDRHAVVFVGALESRKGGVLAVRALAHLAPPARLVVIGDGPERARMTALARRLGVADRVAWLGRVPRAEVVRHLAAAGAVLFTGLREEGGLALAEALLGGLSTVVLGNGGAATVAAAAVDPARVVVVRPGSVGTTARRLAAAVERVTAAAAGMPRRPLLDQVAAQRVLIGSVLAAAREGAAP